MFLKTALIFCEAAETDDELKAIMATHPWAPAMIQGFRKARSSTWEDERWFWSSPPDAIYIDAGFGVSADEKWAVESFHAPTCFLALSSELEDFGKRRKLEEAWWRATTELLLNGIARNYHCHVVEFGEIEDEFEPGQAAESWKETILAAYNYNSKIIAEFEPIT